MAKRALAYLPTALSVALRPPFPFQQGQYAQVFPLKPAPFFKLFVSFSSTNKSAISLLLLSRSVLATLFSPPSFLLSFSLAGTVFSLILFYQAAMGTGTLVFFSATTRLLSWPDGERYLRPQQCLVVSLLLSLVSTLFFSWTGGILSHQNSVTHRLPRFPPRNLCFYVMLAVFSLAFATTDTDFC